MGEHRPGPGYGQSQRWLPEATRSELVPDQDESLWEITGGNERDPWVFTNFLLLKGVTDDELYTFTTSKGGLDAVAVLLEAAGPRCGLPTRNEWPIVR